MNGRGWMERQDMRRDRAAAGYTGVRISKLTLKRLRELEALLEPTDGVRGLDELITELALAELERRRAGDTGRRRRIS